MARSLNHVIHPDFLSSIMHLRPFLAWLNTRRSFGRRYFDIPSDYRRPCIH